MASVKDKRVSKMRTICEVHREIYEIVVDNIQPDLANRIIDLLDEAYKMGKSMNNKLQFYKFNWADEFYQYQQEQVLKEKMLKRGVKKIK